MVLSDFGWSADVPELELSEEGVDEDEDDGLEVEPLPAVPLVLEELLGEVEDEPPPAWSFFCVSDELDDEELDGVALDGLLEGVLVAPDEDDEPEGELDGLVVVDDEPVAARSLPALSHAVSRVAPSAMETATARVDSLMRPPWLGYLGGLSKVWAGRRVT